MSRLDLDQLPVDLSCFLSFPSVALIISSDMYLDATSLIIVQLAESYFPKDFKNGVTHVLKNPVYPRIPFLIACPTAIQSYNSFSQ